MGIDIWARWKGQSKEEIQAQGIALFSVTAGGMGYLREAYHGKPYATRFFVAEVFESEDGKAKIPAATLRERLPHTLELVEERERKIYKSDERTIEEVKQSFRDFVSLCERHEETGEPVEIIASW